MKQEFYFSMRAHSLAHTPASHTSLLRNPWQPQPGTKSPFGQMLPSQHRNSFPIPYPCQQASKPSQTTERGSTCTAPRRHRRHAPNLKSGIHGGPNFCMVTQVKKRNPVSGQGTCVRTQELPRPRKFMGRPKNSKNS